MAPLISLNKFNETWLLKFFAPLIFTKVIAPFI